MCVSLLDHWQVLYSTIQYNTIHEAMQCYHHLTRNMSKAWDTQKKKATLNIIIISLIYAYHSHLSKKDIVQYIQ